MINGLFTQMSMHISVKGTIDEVEVESLRLGEECVLS